ncbi:hypothetical protein C0J52_25157 [Blattella germanica]|nr:hypothetical protein C0J52_25157 [Blattella germanica]
MSLSVTDVAKVVALIEDGRSQRYVSRALGIPGTTIWRVMQCFMETGCYDRIPGSGRLRATSALEDHLIVLRSPPYCY